MKVSVFIHSSPVAEYEIRSTDSHLIHALIAVIHGLDASDTDGMTYRVFDKNNYPMSPANLGIFDTHPGWIYPNKEAIEEEPKQPAINLDAFDPAQRNVIMYLMEEVQKTRQAFQDRDDEIEVLHRDITSLELQVQTLRHRSPLFWNGSPVPPHPLTPNPPFNWQPPGGPRYNSHPNFHPPFFSEGSDFSQPPGWDKPPHR